MKALPLKDGYFTHLELEESNSLDLLLDEVKIDPLEELCPPPVCLYAVNDNGVHSTIGTLGNFSLFIGKAKSRKSFLIGLALSACIKNGTILNRFKGSLPEGKRDVLYFDTEQGKYHVQKAVKRVCAMSGNANPKNFHAYGLRRYHPNKRLELIERAIYSNDNVGFVVIDGIKDLINSINDEAEATMLVSLLLKWTEERNIHIITVLHQNKNDNNARGHLGTELMNKAETVLSVTKSPENKNISIVEAEYCRDKEPEAFAFEIDDTGMPVLAENWQIKTTNKVNDVDHHPSELEALVAQCFFREDELMYGEFQRQMVASYKVRFDRKLGMSKAQALITECKNEGLVFQERKKGPYKRKNNEPSHTLH